VDSPLFAIFPNVTLVDIANKLSLPVFLNIALDIPPAAIDMIVALDALVVLNDPKDIGIVVVLEIL